MLVNVAASAYKAGFGRKGEMCVMCLDRTRGATTRLELAAGVAVWLCGTHRSDDFQRRRAGRDFTLTLLRVWTAAGALTKRRAAALSTHQARLRPRPARRRPGSYAWPALRTE